VRNLKYIKLVKQLGCQSISQMAKLLPPGFVVLLRKKRHKTFSQYNSPHILEILKKVTGDILTLFSLLCETKTKH